MRTPKKYDFSVSLYERKSLIVGLTVLFMILDFIMIYPAMRAGETMVTILTQIILIMQASGLTRLLDLPASMLGEVLFNAFDRKSIRKAALAASGILMIFLLILYSQVWMLKLESAKLSAQTFTSVSRFENTGDSLSVLDGIQQTDADTQQAEEIAKQKLQIAEKTAAISNILPLANSMFLIILSGAGAKKRKLIRLSDREQELFEQRARLIEEKEMYQGLATEQQMLSSDALAKDDMLCNVEIFINTWQRKTMFGAAAQKDNKYFTPDFLRAADIDDTTRPNVNSVNGEN